MRPGPGACERGVVEVVAARRLTWLCSDLSHSGFHFTLATASLRDRRPRVVATASNNDGVDDAADPSGGYIGHLAAGGSSTVYATWQEDRRGRRADCSTVAA